MISIRRTKLVDISYTLRVTLNNSIYVDLPVTLISFLSIDPPPMPSGATGRIADWAAVGKQAQMHTQIQTAEIGQVRPFV